MVRSRAGQDYILSKYLCWHSSAPGLSPEDFPTFWVVASDKLMFYEAQVIRWIEANNKEDSDIVSLFKRGNTWWSYFYDNGIRHQYSTGTSNRRQAETIEAKLKEEVNNQRFQIVRADPNMKFGELVAQFVANGCARPHHLYHLKFLLPFFGETPVLRITKSLTGEFRRQRHSGKSIKDATVNRDLSVLRHILYWAVDE